MEKLQAAITKLPNLAEFCRATGLPRRTLDRIKSGRPISTMTRLAVAAALKTYKAR